MATTLEEIRKKLQQAQQANQSESVAKLDPAEKKRGLESKKHLETLLKPGDNIVLEIPYNGTIGDSVNMSRFLAKVYKDVDGDGEEDNISTIMVRDGYAKEKK
jgi:endonuclease YncB( thermonuclease family)